MTLKTVTYHRFPDGQPFTVEYDADAQCIACGWPVWEASVGGTILCPWCDCGQTRPRTTRCTLGVAKEYNAPLTPAEEHRVLRVILGSEPWTEDFGREADSWGPERWGALTELLKGDAS